MKQHFTAERIYSHGELWSDYFFSVEDGRITAFAPMAEFPVGEGVNLTEFKNAMIIPGLVNSHTHSFQSLLKGFCDDADFFTWRDQALYKYATILTRDYIYTGALFAFGEMLRNGITTVCDFFYINDQANDNAEAIIQAAQDVGIRLVLARTMYDWDGAPSRFCETVAQAVSNTDVLMKKYAQAPRTRVIPAPHSFHGASLPMIQAGVELAQTHNTVWHMHVAEGEYERKMVTEKHGLPPIQFLNKLGLLDRRLVGIHCVWLDDTEITLMGQQGAGLSYNPSSNMFLGDGVTRITDLLKAGVCISLGTDGGCSNNRASIIDEMRMTSLLQKVVHTDATVTRAEDMLMMATANAGTHLNWAIGKLAQHYAADFTVIQLNDLSMQPRQNAIKNLVYSAQPNAIQAAYVAGECVMQDGELQRMLLADIVSKVQAVTKDWG